MPRDIRSLVDRQIVKWNTMKEAEARAHAEAPRRGAQPMVCISREVGSLGRDIAALVADRLNFDLYDRELVERIAENASVRETLVDSVDDRVQDKIESWIGQQFGTAYFAHSDYLRHLSQVLLTMARHGHAVVVGRGAQYILDPAHALRVRVIAPQALRIERMAERHETDTQQARSTTLRVDAERRSFVRRHFDRDLADPSDYDIVLNTGTMAVEVCARLVETAFRGRFG